MILLSGKNLSRNKKGPALESHLLFVVVKDELVFSQKLNEHLNKKQDQ